jgi:hypothetical protein
MKMKFEFPNELWDQIKLFIPRSLEICNVRDCLFENEQHKYFFVNSIVNDTYVVPRYFMEICNTCNNGGFKKRKRLEKKYTIRPRSIEKFLVSILIHSDLMKNISLDIWSKTDHNLVSLNDCTIHSEYHRISYANQRTNFVGVINVHKPFEISDLDQIQFVFKRERNIKYIN